MTPRRFRFALQRLLEAHSIPAPLIALDEIGDAIVVETVAEVEFKPNGAPKAPQADESFNPASPEPAAEAGSAVKLDA